MNFRKAKVSKASWLGAVVLGLLGSTSSPPPLLMLPETPDPAEMAYADAPPLMELPLAGLADDGSQARAASNCANVRRQLRFEMLSANEPYPPPRRHAVVCLAVYRPGVDPAIP